MSPNPILREGAALPGGQPRYVPLTTRRFNSGYVTQRSPFLDAGAGANTRYMDEMLGAERDTLIAGANIELSNRNTLTRRPGFTAYCSQLLGGTPLGFYSWRQLSGTISVLADTSTGVYVITPTTATLLFTKGAGAGVTTFCGVGAQLYMANGVDAKKWNGTTVTNIGIVAPDTAPTLSFGAGSATVKVNWSYVVCYRASSDGSVSSASPFSAFTGPLANASVTVGGDYSSDPQVDTVQIYRTADGGANYYLLASFANVVGNGTWSFTDTLPDSSLNIFLEAPLNGVNNPFPAGGTNLAYYAGRLWCAANGTVYFAGGPDTTNGNGNTAWSALNYFVFPTGVQWMHPAGQSLLVQTTDDLQSIVGTDVQTFYPQLVLNNLGIRTFHAATTNAADFFLFTSDRQFTQMSAANGVSFAGFAIADQMANIDPTQAYVAYMIQGYDYAVYVGDPANGVIYRLNPMQPPMGNAVWSTPYVPTGGFTCMGAVETSPGTHALLIGRSDGSILMRNAAAWGDTPISATPATAALVPYSQCHATIGSVVLASPGQLAEVESLSFDCKAVGQLPSISVLIDEISGAFESIPDSVPDPPQLAASTSVFSNRFYLDQARDPVVMRNIQIDIAFQSESQPNELYAYTIYAAVHLE